jgi:methylase of polypeptide subunit release factors
LRRFYEIIASLEAREWDKIWCRIIKNNFSPRGFAPFDLIVGNPPWVRWSRLPETYRNRVKGFCKYYGLVSGRGYSGGIESDIATVITFSAADNWLRDGGTIAFLITWTVFKSGSARGFRLAELPGDAALKVKQIEDLTRLQPFPDASNATSIYIAQKVRPARRAHRV